MVTDLEDLIEAVAPPASALVGDLASARRVIEPHFRYPSEYWELVATYGAGSFYDQEWGVKLLHPCLFDFALRFALCTNELAAVSSSLGRETRGVRWLPVAEYGEWALFVEASQDPAGRVLFACLGSDGEYAEIAGGIASFIRRFSQADMQSEIFGSEGEVMERTEFFPEAKQFALDKEYLGLETDNTHLSYLPGLSLALRQACTLDLPIVE